MKAKKTTTQKEPHVAPFPFGDFEKMAEKMKTFCQREGDAFDCCSFMRKMMGQGKRPEAEETKETQEQSEGGEKA